MNEKILNIVYFLILTIPIFFSVSWHYNNTQLPVSDAIGWLEATSNILPIWENGKIASSVYELFLNVHGDQSYFIYLLHLSYF